VFNRDAGPVVFSLNRAVAHPHLSGSRKSVGL
jgi:hypothetical protein